MLASDPNLANGYNGLGISQVKFLVAKLQMYLVQPPKVQFQFRNIDSFQTFKRLNCWMFWQELCLPETPLAKLSNPYMPQIKAFCDLS